MIRRCTLTLLAGLLLVAPTAARADFGFVPESLSAVAKNKDGTLDNQASTHPYSFTTHFAFETDQDGRVEGGEPHNIVVDLPPGMVGNPLAVPRCPRQLFEGFQPQCPGNTQVGILDVVIPSIGLARGPVYNMIASPGVAAQIGLSVANFNSIQSGVVRTEEGLEVSRRIVGDRDPFHHRHHRGRSHHRPNHPCSCAQRIGHPPYAGSSLRGRSAPAHADHGWAWNPLEAG